MFRTPSGNRFVKYEVDGKRIVRKMPLHLFQERLVEHFDIRFKKKKYYLAKKNE